jgi:hypothetical protein
VFQKEAKKIAAAAHGLPNEGEVDCLLQGTLYPDVIEKISFKRPSATIKTHHNVGGLLEGMHLNLSASSSRTRSVNWEHSSVFQKTLYGVIHSLALQFGFLRGDSSE